MFHKAKEIEREEFSFGIPQLDELVDHKGGIILFRTNSRKFAFEVGSMALLKNMDKDEKELLLHLVDYHERYWTIDLDHLIDLAEDFDIEEEEITEKINVLRAFSPGQVEEERNWDSIKEFIGEDTSLVVVDSMEELYSSNYSEESSKEDIRKLVAQLHQTSMECNCPVLLFDYSAGSIDSFLSQIASTIVSADVTEQGMALKVLKGGKENQSQEKKQIQWRR